MSPRQAAVRSQEASRLTAMPVPREVCLKPQPQQLHSSRHTQNQSEMVSLLAVPRTARYGRGKVSQRMALKGIITCGPEQSQPHRLADSMNACLCVASEHKTACDTFLKSGIAISEHLTSAHAQQFTLVNVPHPALVRQTLRPWASVALFEQLPGNVHLSKAGKRAPPLGGVLQVISVRLFFGAGSSSSPGSAASAPLVSAACHPYSKSACTQLGMYQCRHG